MEIRSRSIDRDPGEKMRSGEMVSTFVQIGFYGQTFPLLHLMSEEG